MKYIVWSYDYMDASAGQKTMHRLCHELNEAGQEAYVYFRGVNSAWNTPYYGGPFDDDWLAIYPEICTNNPIEGISENHVLRWMLNRAHAHYEPVGEWFSFQRLFTPPDFPEERMLFLPTIELDRYYDMHLPRTLWTYWIGKESARREVPPGFVEISRAMTGDTATLARTLNQSIIMWSFDPISAMNEIARLCGSKVMWIPGGHMTKDEFDSAMAPIGEGWAWDDTPPDFDPEVTRQRQIDLKSQFYDQLQHFIRITQAL